MLRLGVTVLLAIILPTSHALRLADWENQAVSKAISKLQKPRVRIISDTHIGSCWGSDKDVQTKLVALLYEMTKPSVNNPTHLVINGDLWDWWMVPLNETHPDPTSLFQNTDAHGYNVPQIIDLIKKASKQMKIYLVRGNHDDLNSKELTEQAFGDAVEFMEDGFEIEGVWIEHGNVVDPYYQLPLKDGKKKMSWSYFESRASATALGPTCNGGGKKKRQLDFMASSFKRQEEFIAGMLDKYTPDAVFAQTFEPASFQKHWLKPLMESALSDKTGSPPSDWQNLRVKGFDPITQTIKVNDENETYTLGDALNDHADDADWGRKEMGRDHFNARLWVAADNHFQWVPLSRNHLVIVTSHNHDPTSQLMQRQNPFQSVSNYVVRANSGAFGKDSFGRKHSSYLDIDFAQIDESIEGSLEKGSWRPTSVSYYEYPSPVPRETTTVPKPWPGKTVGGFDFSLHPSREEMIVGKPKSDFF